MQAFAAARLFRYPSRTMNRPAQPDALTAHTPMMHRCFVVVLQRYF